MDHEPKPRKHPNVIHIDEAPAREGNQGKFAFKSKRLWPSVGGKQLACSWFEVPPGKQAFPHHFHSAFEESIYILEGRGSARIGENLVEVGVGDYIAFPPGPDTAHSLFNTGDTPLRYLCMSTLHTLDIVVYPDSKKVAIAAGVDPAKGLMSGPSWVLKIVPLDQPSLGYYDGEEDA